MSKTKITIPEDGLFAKLEKENKNKKEQININFKANLLYWCIEEDNHQKTLYNPTVRGYVRGTLKEIFNGRKDRYELISLLTEGFVEGLVLGMAHLEDACEHTELKFTEKLNDEKYKVTIMIASGLNDIDCILKIK